MPASRRIQRFIRSKYSSGKRKFLTVAARIRLRHGQRLAARALADYGGGQIDGEPVDRACPAGAPGAWRLSGLAAACEGDHGVSRLRLRRAARGGVRRRLFLARLPVVSPAAELQSGVLDEEGRAQK